MRKLTWKDVDGKREYYVDGKLYATIDLERLTDEIHWMLIKDFEDF